MARDRCCRALSEYDRQAPFCGAKRRQINVQTFLFFNSALLGKFVLFILISVALVIGIATMLSRLCRTASSLKGLGLRLF